LSYCFDFTHSYHRRRQAVLVMLVALLLACGAGSGRWGWQVYLAWQEPDLAQQLLAVENMASRIEPLYTRWRESAEQFQSVAPFYGLLWSENAVEALALLAGWQAQLPSQLVPVRWEVNTGGACVLTCRLRLDERNKRGQIESARASLEALPRPAPAAASWTDKDLAGIAELEMTVRFTLAAAAHTVAPGPPDSLKKAVEKIEARRKAVLAHALNGGGADLRIVRSVLETVLDAAYPKLSDDHVRWRERLGHMISPGIFLRDLERELADRNLPVPKALPALRDEWNRIASRRMPWRRLSSLDNSVLQEQTEALKALVEAGLPGIAMFDGVCGRIRTLKQALSAGYDFSAVFDEGYATRRLEQELGAIVPGAWQVKVERAPVHDGVMLATWTLTLRSAPRPGGGGQIPLAEAVRALRHIGGMQAGFVVRKVVLNMQAGTGTGTMVQDVVAEGLLAIHEAGGAVGGNLAQNRDGGVNAIR